MRKSTASLLTVYKGYVACSDRSNGLFGMIPRIWGGQHRNVRCGEWLEIYDKRSLYVKRSKDYPHAVLDIPGYCEKEKSCTETVWRNIKKLGVVLTQVMRCSR